MYAFLHSIGKELFFGMMQLLKFAAFICIGIVVIFFTIPLVLMLLGYKVDADPTRTAEAAVKRGTVSDCRRIIRYGVLPLGPTSAEMRASCMRTYAEITQDPIICESLMPTSYGLNCIGDIWGPLIDKSNCHWYKDNAVRCFEGPKLISHIFDCGDPEQRAVSDECKHRFAFKQKNGELCEAIGNATLQSVCRVRIDTWKRYPELRSTIYFNDDIK